MALPTTTASVLHAVTGTIIGWSVGEEANGTIVITEWNTGDLGTQPTEQQINDWATDTVNLPSGQPFSVWLAENGGDPVLTHRRQAIEEADTTESFVGVRNRALIELLNKRDNYLTNRIAELQAALDAVKASTGPADNMRAAIPASWLATNTRTKADAVQDYKDDINAGNQD